MVPVKVSALIHTGATSEGIESWESKASDIATTKIAAITQSLRDRVAAMASSAEEALESHNPRIAP